jgi:hypothetical protein
MLEVRQQFSQQRISDPEQRASTKSVLKLPPSENRHEKMPSLLV